MSVSRRRIITRTYVSRMLRSGFISSEQRNANPSSLLRSTWTTYRHTIRRWAWTWIMAMRVLRRKIELVALFEHQFPTEVHSRLLYGFRPDFTSNGQTKKSKTRINFVSLSKDDVSKHSKSLRSCINFESWYTFSCCLDFIWISTSNGQRSPSLDYVCTPERQRCIDTWCVSKRCLWALTFSNIDFPRVVGCYILWIVHEKIEAVDLRRYRQQLIL